MNLNFVEVVIESEVEAGELLGMLENTATSGGWEEKGSAHLYWPEDSWSDAILEDIRGALKQLGIEGENVKITVGTVADRDWNATWAASLEPIRLGRRFRIRQSWNPADPDFNGIELVIDPKRAFGTGYHATTRMVIEWLEENIRGGEKVLDIGTGSGILSMAAIRLGARSSYAVDVDPVALECAKEYAQVNGFGEEIDFRVASFEELDSVVYDVILANIDGKTLPALCPHLPRLTKKGSLVCFSGLQHPDYRAIEDALNNTGFRIYAHRQQGEWLALELKNVIPGCP